MIHGRLPLALPLVPDVQWRGRLVARADAARNLVQRLGPVAIRLSIAPGRRRVLDGGISDLDGRLGAHGRKHESVEVPVKIPDLR